jgi:hypothetical protein
MTRSAFVLLGLALALLFPALSLTGRGSGWAVPVIAVGPPSPEPPVGPDRPGTPSLPVYRTPPPLATAAGPAHPTAVITHAPSVVITRAAILHSVNGHMKSTHTLDLGEAGRFVLSWRASSALAVAPSAYLVIHRGATPLYRRALHGQNGLTAGSLQTSLRIRSTSSLGPLIADFLLTGPVAAQRAIAFRVVQGKKARCPTAPCRRGAA